VNRIAAEIVIIGGGPAGMAAALAAAKVSKSVAVVDDNPRLGGQIWRAELKRTKASAAAKLISAIESGSIRLICNAQVFDVSAGNVLAAATPDGRVEIEYGKLILATGARERFLPFPGWTLPGVFGVGGLQALVKGGFGVAGKRVVVAGTGPLLLGAAEYLRSKGAIALAIVEQAPPSQLRRLGMELCRRPSKLIQAAVLRAKLIGIPYLTDCWVSSAEGEQYLERVRLQHKGKPLSIECDQLACGFHLMPNTELATLLGCDLEDGFVAVDAFQRTSCENVYCAGEPAGIAGLDASLIEGTIAGFAAAGNTDGARALFAGRDRWREFGRVLDRTFELRPELRYLAEDNTIICRCEDVPFAKVKEFDNWRSAKLQTRCGMGPCQGRVCRAAAEFLFGWKTGLVRPPIFPVRSEDL